MSWREFFGGLLRQTSAASAWLTGLLLVAERLAPGSVSPYLDLPLLAAVSFTLAIAAPAPSDRPAAWRAFGLAPVAFLLVAFLFLVTSDLGRSGLTLTAAAALLAVAWLACLAYPSPD